MASYLETELNSVNMGRHLVKSHAKFLKETGGSNFGIKSYMNLTDALYAFFAREGVPRGMLGKMEAVVKGDTLSNISLDK